MPRNPFRLVAASVFSVIALAFAWKLYFYVPVRIGIEHVSVEAAMAGLLLSAGLASWGFLGKP